MAPLVTGATGTNPGLRLFEYEIRRDELKNYHQFVLDLSEANENKSAKWRLAYDFCSEYNVPDLSVESVAGVFRQLADENQDSFEKYYSLNTLGHYEGEGLVASYNRPHCITLLFEGPCESDCKRDQLCAISHVTVEGMKKCRTPPPSLSIQRKPGEGALLVFVNPRTGDIKSLSVLALSLIVIFMVVLIALLVVYSINIKRSKRNDYVRIAERRV